MDTYSIFSGVEDPENLYSNQSGGRAKETITYRRGGKKITYTRRKRKSSRGSAKKATKKRSRRGSRRGSRSRSRSRSRGGCKTSHKIAPGTCGFPTLAQVDQYSDDGEDIKKTVRGVTRYLEYDSTDGKYYWIKTNTGKKRKSYKLGSSLTSKGNDKGDFMAMYMWLKKQRAEREAAAIPPRGELTDGEWNAYKGSFDSEFKPKNFITSDAIGACVHSTSFQGENNFTEESYAKHTFVWKGDVKVQEDNEVHETCQNIMFFGVVDNQEDLWRYSSEPGYANLFGREICNALYNASGPTSSSSAANHAAIRAVLNKAEYNPTGNVSMIVLQKVAASQNGYPKVTAYKLSKGPGANIAQPRFFTIPNGATKDKMVELSSSYVTLPDDDPSANIQLHIVLGNTTFMTNTQQGFLDWLFGADDTTSVTAKNVDPSTCEALAQAIARKNQGKTVTCMYAVLDEKGMTSALQVFQPPPPVGLPTPPPGLPTPAGPLPGTTSPVVSAPSMPTTTTSPVGSAPSMPTTTVVPPPMPGATRPVVPPPMPGASPVAPAPSMPTTTSPVVPSGANTGEDAALEEIDEAFGELEF